MISVQEQATKDSDYCWGCLQFCWYQIKPTRPNHTSLVKLLVVKQETIGVRSSKSMRAKTEMSKAFGQRWSGRHQVPRMPDEEKDLYTELEAADQKRFDKEVSAVSAQGTTTLKIV